jgi:hypothetical protein
MNIIFATGDPNLLSAIETDRRYFVTSSNNRSKTPMGAILRKEPRPDFQERLLVGPYQLVHVREDDNDDPEWRDTWVLPGTGSLSAHEKIVQDAERRRQLAKQNVYLATTADLQLLAAVNGWERPMRVRVPARTI